ncbi:hypothetical protein [Glaciihabitans sp. UYNi722]|uniref:hypothetical protein n=1 Tax=Glaciihabitans sp. UYNi722 TaxID=3156344 RepID=UPI003392F86B
MSGTTGATEISLAEVLLDKGRAVDVEYALILLDSWMSRHESKFNSTLFRWHLARIRVADHFGDRETAHSSAVTALELAGSGPQLPRHKSVGLVKTNKSTLRRLKRLSK